MTVDQHHGNRLADDIGAVDDADVLAGGVNSIVVQDFKDRLGGAGRQGRGVTENGLSHVDDRAGVHVLLRVDDLRDGGLFVDVVQRTERENAVDGRVLIQRFERRDVILLGHIDREGRHSDVDPDLGQGGGGAALIREVRSLLPDAKDGELRRDTGTL